MLKDKTVTPSDIQISTKPYLKFSEFYQQLAKNLFELTMQYSQDALITSNLNAKELSLTNDMTKAQQIILKNMKSQMGHSITYTNQAHGLIRNSHLQFMEICQNQLKENQQAMSQMGKTKSPLSNPLATMSEEAMKHFLNTLDTQHQAKDGILTGRSATRM